MRFGFIAREVPRFSHWLGTSTWGWPAQVRYNRAKPDSALPKITLHGLRHGWATLALEAGVPIRVVQHRLNHSSEAVTADIYTHVRAPLQSDAAERVASMILPTSFGLPGG